MTSSLESKFYERIRHNFRKYVMLTSNRMHLNEDSILHYIYHLDGYKAHKKIKYGQFTSHIIIKFHDVYYAMEAVARLNFENLGLTAVLVDDMLKDWFTYEMETYRGTPYSLTIVDVTGSPPLNLNFLTSNILNTILQDFGETYFLPYTAALNKPHVQVLFDSMTEALAASIAFGEWYHLESKIDTFSHRVRINPSKKEECLIKNCGGMPYEAFKLDYFVRIKKESKIQTHKDIVTKGKEYKTKMTSTKEMQKLHQQRHLKVQSPEVQQINPFAHGIPIFYFPIIATNASNKQVLNNKFGTEFTTALLNLQQTFTTQAIIAISNSETKDKAKHRNKQMCECVSMKNWENSQFAQTRLSTWTKVNGNHRRATRVFERSSLSKDME